MAWPAPRTLSGAEEDWRKMRTVVIGASSGLGRCIGIGLAKRGATVALLARRKTMLEDAAKEAGPGALAIECDVTDEASCRSAIANAADGLGGIDGLIYAPGIGPLSRLVDTDAATWRRVLDTNVMGAALATAAAIPHLSASAGKAIYLSSVAGQLTPPWPGLGAYATSKAALSTLIDAWRGEHPDIGFTRLVVGDCAGGEGDAMTQFTAGWNQELAATCYPVWMARGYMAGALMDVEDLVTVVDTTLHPAASTTMPMVVATARPAATQP